MVKVVVLGSTGMAGHVVSQYLQEHSYEVYRISRSEILSEKSAQIDVCDIFALEQYLDTIHPDVIINCVGLLQKSCEDRPDLAVRINSYLPKRLEYKYQGSDTRIIHLSTDCVFSGQRGGYQENDLPDGRTMYDRSKALGEVVNQKDLTLRMSIIGPDRDINGTGLFNWFMKQAGSIAGYRKVIWNGITTIELARGVDAAIRCRLSGIYQLVTPQSIDKYHLLLLIKEVFHKRIEIIPDDTVVLDKSLINTRSDFGFDVQTYRGQIQDMYTWVEQHRQLYDYYNISSEKNS